MITAMEWVRDALRGHPELAVFLAVAAGYLLAGIRIKSFRLEPVVGCLIAGVVVGQLGITIPDELSNLFFLLFVFAVGYKSGPRFFSSIGKNAVSQLSLALIFCATGLLTAYAVSRAVGFDTGTAAGLLAGSLNSETTVGTAGEAIRGLAISGDVRQRLMASLTVAYAVSFLIGTFTSLLVLSTALVAQQPQQPSAPQPAPQQTPDQIMAQAQPIMQDAQSVVDQLALYKRLHKDQQQLQQLQQQYQQAQAAASAKPAPAQK